MEEVQLLEPLGQQLEAGRPDQSGLKFDNASSYLIIMGKRKSSKQPAKKGEYRLPTEFDCPFCNFHRCVEVLM